MNNPNKELLVLRTDDSGKLVALSDSAKEVFGGECVGRLCNQVVGGRSPGGESICRHGCAAELAQGRLPSPEGRNAVIGRSHSQLTCVRVGDETVVVIEPDVQFDKTERLSPRELDVLALVAQGLSTKAIATDLGLSPATIRTHVEHARNKLDAATRAEAVVRAIATGQLRGLC